MHQVKLKRRMLFNSVADLNKTIFTLTYRESSAQKGWERTILIYDQKDNELKKHKKEESSY